MNPKAPKILNDIVTALCSANLKAVTEDDEGRVNSKKDENNVIAWLMAQPQFDKKVFPVGLRQFGDMIVIDEHGNRHFVNIKTSGGQASDNAFSKLGFLWAFTNLPEEKMPRSISNKKWFELISKNKTDLSRDYWFLSLDKNNMNNAIVRGVKQIVNWHGNPTNNLQIKWGDEHKTDLVEYTFEEAWQRVIVNGVLACWEKYCEGMLEGIKYRQSEISK